jgi:uncharacterized protein YndB with AHSA1/START domain/predicted enzyme related to lactoylglutathione lyase
MIIRQISVKVDDQEKALKFYTEVLGFVRKTDAPMGKGGRFLALASPTDSDGPELLLAANTNSTAKTFQKAMKKAGEPIAAFQVSDVNKEFKRLKKLGVKFTKEPYRAGAPIIRAVLDDTCGNLIKIYQYWTYEGETISVTIKRHFEASPERVYDAWVKPEIASKWLFAGKTSTAADYLLDVKLGGEYRITRHGDEGKKYVAVGKYEVLDRPRKLVFTFAMPQFAVDVGKVEVEITPDGDGSLVTFTQHGDRPGYEKSTRHGWEGMFIRLERTLAAQDKPSKPAAEKKKKK